MAPGDEKIFPQMREVFDHLGVSVQDYSTKEGAIDQDQLDFLFRSLNEMYDKEETDKKAFVGQAIAEGVYPIVKFADVAEPMLCPPVYLFACLGKLASQAQTEQDIPFSMMAFLKRSMHSYNKLSENPQATTNVMMYAVEYWLFAPKTVEVFFKSGDDTHEVFVFRAATKANDDRPFWGEHPDTQGYKAGRRIGLISRPVVESVRAAVGSLKEVVGGVKSSL